MIENPSCSTNRVIHERDIIVSKFMEISLPSIAKRKLDT